MNTHTIFGLDLAKRKFHVVAMDAQGKKIASAKLLRDEVLPYFSGQNTGSIIAMEACGGCHYWAQQLRMLGLTVKLLKTKDIKPYARSRQKNDTNDALAIAKAARDPELKEVMPKTIAEQEVMLLHKMRQNTIKQRVRKTNSLLGILSEFGYIATANKAMFAKQATMEIEQAFAQKFISENTQKLLRTEAEDIADLLQKEKTIDQQILQHNKDNSKAKNLQTIPGIGPINASILAVCAMESYDTPRDFASSLGLVPSQHTTGGKIQLGGISKQGSRYARTMLIQGARTIVMRARSKQESNDKLIRFARQLLLSKSFNQTSVAVANKLARISHAVATKGMQYRQ